ncbi:MAG: phosphatidate cytidylyltransferase [Candidatus Competibacteraceae bacterium]
MLKQRLITASILAMVVIVSVLLLPTAGFGGVLLVFILVGAWEWGGLLFKPTGQIAYCLLMAGLIGLAWGFLESRLFIRATAVTACLFWCYVLFRLWRYARNPYTSSTPAWGAAGIMTLLPMWVTLMDLHRSTAFGPAYVLFVIVLVAAADSSAYFAGRRWGRHKLAPRLSPGKTREGALAALAVTLVLAWLGAVLLGIDAWLPFLLICLVTTVFSIIGDLFESMLKRQHTAKDSSTLLPGHGGLLDRMDSLTAAAPIFLVGLSGLLP